ncbi:MAG: cadherin-like beta sandwich domain-containing protein [Firmicutes bacterium]|nr:cadherin-like beta sandwich domain-containing protein [Bacillota bacterium]
MKRKVISAIIIVFVVLASIIVPRIYAAASTAVSIPNTSVKPGEQIKVYINVGNITTYTLSEAVLSTDIYLEPQFDAGAAGMTASDAPFDPTKSPYTLTISNIENRLPDASTNAQVNTLCVIYTVPTYIAGGTTINITYTLSDSTGMQETNTIPVTVASNTTNNTTSQSTTNITPNQNTAGNTVANGTASNTKSSNNSTKNQTAATSSYSGMTGGNTQTVTYKGSRDNYLTNMTVTGYDLTPGFNKTNNTYFITVENGVTSININAVKEDRSAVVTISGNKNLQVGLNKVLIAVLAQNGDVRYYRIYVTRD